eukprot:Lankesteria_metandrocarpae@DN3358_c0_g1_i2.p1
MSDVESTQNVTASTTCDKSVGMSTSSVLERLRMMEVMGLRMAVGEKEADIGVGECIAGRCDNRMDCRLRINVYNTSTNQAHHLEADSFRSETWLRDVPPCWTLRVEGAFVDPPPQFRNLKFTSIFDKIVVILPNETLIWDRKSCTDGIDNIAPFAGKSCSIVAERDGFEVNRRGVIDTSVPEVVFVLLFPSGVHSKFLRRPEWTASPMLRHILATRDTTIESATVSLSRHIRPMNNGQSFTPDVVACQLFNLPFNCNVSLTDLSQRISQNLAVRSSICIPHRLSVDTTVQSVDINVDLPLYTPVDYRYSPTDEKKKRNFEELQKYQMKLSLVESNLEKLVLRLSALVRRRNYLKAFATDANKFLDSILSGHISTATPQYPNIPPSGPNPIQDDGEHYVELPVELKARLRTGSAPDQLLDRNFIDDYGFNLNDAKVYCEPWAMHGVNQYLSKKLTPLSSILRDYVSSVACLQLSAADFAHPVTGQSTYGSNLSHLNEAVMMSSNRPAMQRRAQRRWLPSYFST